MDKLPPIEKVFEAWTAVADGRVALEDGSARVTSSDGSKVYTVRFAGDRYSSDDNATYWRGYAGYPVLAVLMLQGRLPLDRDEAELWRNVDWKEINTRFRNNYSKAASAVAEARHIDLVASYQAAQNVLDSLKRLPLTIARKV